MPILCFICWYKLCDTLIEKSKNRAVCGPADVREAELDRARREATEGAEAMSENIRGDRRNGVLSTRWEGATVAGEA